MYHIQPSFQNIFTMKFWLTIFLLVWMPLEISATDVNDIENDDDGLSVSASFSQSASLSIHHQIPCIFRGGIKFHGQKWKLSRCLECKCNNGSTTCTEETCETDLRCQAAETVVKEGECCPHCPHGRNCSFQGISYPPKHRIQLDSCTVCTCGVEGSMDCHVRACGSHADVGCRSSEIVVVSELCCPVCPYKLVVEHVQISHDREYTLGEESQNTVRFSVHVKVNKATSSLTVKGEQMWRLSAWISKEKDGSGLRMSYQPNIFSEEHAKKSYHRHRSAGFTWFGLRFRTPNGEEPTESYLCVEFDKGKNSRPLYNISFTFYPYEDNRENLVGCLEISTQNVSLPVFHHDLQSRRFFQRNIGDSIDFSCNVTNARTVEWKHSSWATTEKVSHNSTLRIDNITLQDQGSYYCVAKGHGEHVRSAEQILIIPALAQFLLRIDGNASNPQNQDRTNVFQQNLLRQMEKAHILAHPVNSSNEATLTIYLSIELKSEQELDMITNDIWEIIQQERNASSLTGSHSIVRLEGLSFCYSDLVVTDAGNLSFDSANVNSGSFSNEFCFAPDKLSRGTRRCDGNLVTTAMWEEVQIKNCFNGSTKEVTSSFFEMMKNRVVTENNASFVSKDLLDIATATSLGIEEITRMVPVLEQVSSANSTDPVVTSNILRFVDKIINVTTKMAPSEQLQPVTSSKILHSVELQLEHIQKSGMNFSSSLPNIEAKVVQVLNLNEPISFTVYPFSNKIDQNGSTDSMNTTTTEKIPGETEGASIEIPSAVLKLASNGTVFPLTFTSYQSGVLFHDGESRKKYKFLDSLIISATTEYKVENLPKGSLIRTSFSSLEGNILEHSCVFWDHRLNRETGGWSSEGCHSKKATDSFSYICECDHLTHFAVLVRTDLNNENRLAEIFAIAGCILAMVMIAVTTCTYLALRDLRNGMPHQITLNLCIALLGLYCCFLLGKGVTDRNPGCAILAVLTQYFCITSVAWMSVQATVMYFFEHVSTHPCYILVPALVVSWGLPFLLVAFSSIVAAQSYTHGDYCLPSFSSVAFYIALLGVVGILVAYNAVMYFLISWKLWFTNMDTSQMSHDKTPRRLQTSGVICFFFSLSWLFGFISVGNPLVVYGLMFGVFSTLLGFWIFLQHCLQKEAVHDAWRHVKERRESGMSRIGSDTLQMNQSQ